MYKLKQMVKRGSAFAGAVGLLAGIGTSALPALVHADALNPLTERSLSLSSSSPGWDYVDGSGNSTYAPPGSGANGQKTSNFFTFRVSSTATIHALTFQYCTRPAGTCSGPGDNAGDPSATPNDTTTTSDLNVVTDGTKTPAEITSANWTTISGRTSTTKTDNQNGLYPLMPNMDNSEGNFVVLTAPYNATVTSGVPYAYPVDGSSNPIEDWTMTATHNEDGQHVTDKNNEITISSATGLNLHAGDYVKIAFFANNYNYITNPGSGAFFVKINDYSDTAATTVVDGGVTVANVMNQSISIQTKVLETMDFSVGTVDPDTLTDESTGGSAPNDHGSQLYIATNGGRQNHGPCDPILPSLTYNSNNNILTLGDASSENSLATDATFATHSFWRLSSNSSGGATVYYSGSTLSNTEGDQIKAIGTTAKAPLTSSEQFGLALDNGSSGNYSVDYGIAAGSGAPSNVAYESGADGNKSALSPDWTAYESPLQTAGSDIHNPQLAPLVPTANYGGGTGGINSVDSGGITSSYAFDPNAITSPVPIASEASQVVDCVTGKMRYIANIAATTPAGIYTTRVNYIASPQY